ncbi:protein Wnt-8b [Octopus vulgaris]|uniref:Protein Wnt n=1 Tax=Octopus vulgaris TaxID=6645 RepID=A0AA36ANX7_OCTVU|nr:protein Wnt-8b [Octopus vulgaris]
MLNTNINNRVTLFETPLGLIFLIIMSLANWRIISAWSVNKILMTGPKMNEFGANATTYLMFSDIVASGEKKAAAECRYQFRLDRWNCPEESIMTQKSRLSATQEASFVQSILAAGIMHTLTRRCSLGHFSDCGCDDSKKGKRGGHNWLWSGCSDDVRFSARVSKQLIDSLEKGKDALASMKLHNNEVGRMASIVDCSIKIEKQL